MFISILTMHAHAVNAQCNLGDVRLVNGSVPNEGRVEVCVTFTRRFKRVNDWGTVCSDDWESNDSKVVCKQLNYMSHGESSIIGA